MRVSAKILLVAVAVLIGTWAAAQMGVIGAPTPSTTAIRVLSPKSGQVLSANIISVRFELTNPRAVAAPSPNFRVQLDNGDPILTSSTEYTFTGLAPGKHSVVVQLVDANETPVAGSRVEVPFAVAQAGNAPTGPPRSSVSPIEPPHFQPASYVVPQDNDADELPSSGSALPLLSVIGFGVLVGGIATAMRTR